MCVSPVSKRGCVLLWARTDVVLSILGLPHVATEQGHIFASRAEEADSLEGGRGQ